MPSNRIASAFIEVALQGLSAVQNNLNQIRESVSKASKPLALPTSVSGVEEIQAKLDKLHQGEPIRLPVLAEGLSQVQEKLRELRPQAIQFPVVAQGLDAIQAKLQQIKANPQSIPFLAQGLDAIEAQLKAIHPEAEKVPFLATGLEAIKADVAKLRIAPVNVSFVSDNLSKLQEQVSKVKASVPIDPDIKGLEGRLAAIKAKIPVDPKIEGLEERLAAAKAKGIPVPISPEGLKNLQEKLANLKARPVPVALANLDKINQELNNLKGKPVDIKILTSNLDAIQANLDKLKLPSLKAPVVLEGIQAAEAAIQEIKSSKASVPVMLDAKDTQEQVSSFLAQLEAKIKASPIYVPISVGTEVNRVVANIKASLASLPKEKRTRFLLDNIALAKNQLAELKAQLAATPNNKLVKIKVEATKGVINGLNQELKGLNTEQPETSLRRLSRAFSSIGMYAHIGFGMATAAITKFVTTADPERFEDFKGVWAQISVQIGSIFIPILEKVNQTLNKVLNWFRQLTQEQKANILRWVQIGVLALGGISAFLLAAAAITKITYAVQVLTTSLGIASGGILPIIGLLAGLAVAMLTVDGAFGNASEGASGIGSIFNSLKPILESLQSLFTTVMDIVGEAVLKLLPVFQGLIETIAPIISGIVSIVSSLLVGLKPIFTFVIELIASVGDWFSIIFAQIGAYVDALADSFQNLVPLFQGVCSFLVAILSPVAKAFDIVFGGIKIAIDLVIRSIIFLGTLLANIAKGNFLTAYSKAKDAVAEYDKKVKESEDKATKRKEDRQKVGKEPIYNSASQQGQSFAPKQQEYKVSFTDVLGVFKQAQESAGTKITAEEKASEERDRIASGIDKLNDNQKKTNELLGDKDNRKKYTG